MGTRSLTIFKDQGRLIACVYRQYDGYPSGHGKELADFLLSKILVNGFGLNHPDNTANGMGDLAAQFIHLLKEDSPIGGIYMAHPNQYGGIDYTYTVEGDTFHPGLPLQVTVKRGRKVLFKGTKEDFSAFCENDNN